MADQEDDDWPGSLDSLANRVARLTNICAAYGLIYATEECRDIATRARAMADIEKRKLRAERPERGHEIS